MEALELTDQQIILIVMLAVWSYVWKAIALWAAATNRRKDWFVALFIFNTLGLLEILYIFVFSKTKNPSAE